MTSSSTYPSMWPGDTGPATTSTSAAGTDPFRQDYAVLNMQPYWGRMQAVTSGTDFMRYNAPTYLPQEPREDDDAYQTRVQRSVLSPYTVRLIENAAGLVLRRPIKVEGDSYWTEFSDNVDGLGSSINEYARGALVSALTYGHSGILVDFPADAGVRTLAEERALGRRPYFNHIDAFQIWGWRQENSLPSSDLTQLRLHQWTTVPEGEYGEKRVEEIRVIYRDSWQLFRRGHDYDSTLPTQNGALPLGEIPFVPIYTNRLGMLISSPPLIDIANLNITHYQRQADLIHALHIAAMPILILEGWDESDNASVGVNYALAMQPGNKAYYVGADSSSFTAQQNEIQALESQMSTLGVTKLLGQKFVAESADAKRIDQAQANSVLAIIAMELESALQQAYDLAARYIGIKPPTIILEKDFDFYRLLGQDIAVLGDLARDGLLTQDAFLKILRQGEIMPDTIDINKELAATQQLANEKREKEVEPEPVEVDPA